MATKRGRRGSLTYKRFWKRVIDLLIIVPLIPLMVLGFMLLAAAIRLDSPGAVLVRQIRVGYRRKKFTLYKLRTMTNKAREHVQVLPDDPDITAVGRWLRRFKLDELPQAYNILRGDMSVVGPRPVLPDQLINFMHGGQRRLLVRPGLTGLAQVNGNIYLLQADRLTLDLKYVRECSLKVDLEIISKTIGVLALGKAYFARREKPRPPSHPPDAI